MKNLTLRTIALTFVGVLFMNGAMAQQVVGDYDPILTDATTANTTYVTVDKAVPVFATPDAVFHPTWAFPSTNITPGFTWSFSLPTAADAGKVTFNQPGTLNYVEITGVTVGGPYLVNVEEIAPLTFGGCTGSTVSFNVIVTDKPVAGITGTAVGDANWKTTTVDHEYYRCGNLAGGENLTVAFTEAGAPVALHSYAYNVTKRVINLDSDGNEIDADGVTAGVQPISLASISDRTTAAKYAAGALMTEVIGTGALSTTADRKRTKYTFTLSKASDLPALTAEGVVSAISEKSDYVGANGVPAVADITTYPFSGTVTVVYIVNATPVTGPIYHIANNFGV